MVKVIIIIMLLGCVVLAGVYFLQYASYDPDKEGAELKAAIQPGMTWTEVLDLAKRTSPKYQHISKQKQSACGSMTQVVGMADEEEYVLVAEPKANFDRAKLQKRLASGEEPYGFMLSWLFSNRLAFAVQFDEAGIVTDVHDEHTVSELFK
ncbi:MAG: hypothetical protein JXQ73_23960 [Phycisphaerae bacterium]|nr:hypothetical protein [Phycisphaerae bacterium]